MTSFIEDLTTARRAAEMVFNPSAVEIWLYAPNEQLEGFAPSELIRGGELNRVLDLVDALAEGVVF